MLHPSENALASAVYHNQLIICIGENMKIIATMQGNVKFRVMKLTNKFTTMQICPYILHICVILFFNTVIVILLAPGRSLL